MGIAIAVFIVAALVLLCVGYFVSLYNSLVRLRNNVKESWSNIDVLMKQRHDEIPKLIAACKEYMSYEKGTFQKIVEARQQVETVRQSGDVAQMGAAETALRGSLNGLFALAENYPDLKANASFQQLQSRISDLETKISDRRELYNDSVNINNIAIEQFPATIIANHYHFTHSDLLQFTVEETKDVDVTNLFEGK
ncbi:MAG: LemA family protein [Gammaproteobacteria bacterium RIFCSPHIGHO2_12_FULL_40_19]|nr:MAG: LemA family protein [Gammaproteobacteria bacterium RIFCSPHIGHO2_12_FULL_40_19]